MIVATAGHVDHGKTTLIRALTGVDTDRLPEERARGMTIDLGFAYLPLPGAGTDDPAMVIGFIDVPGHERFVRNMLAGVAGIDFALLVVAADDGPMPQTREHLQILSLLGISHGVVALTKSDRVDAARLATARAEVTALLDGTALEGSAIVACSAVDGLGVAELRAQLIAAQRMRGARGNDGHFRLAIDRSFVLEGAGRVVTGTVYSGSATVGDALVVAPQGQSVRVRSIHSQNRQANVAQAGQRCGINVAGAELRRHELHRGDWLVEPALASTATRIGVRMRLSAHEARALRDRTPVHVHLGASDFGGRIGLLQEGPLQAGEDCFAVLSLDAPVLAVRGDRFVLRDQSATRTLGGGMVLEALPFPGSLSRLRRIALLEAMARPNAGDALAAALDAAPEGIEVDWFARCWNLRSEVMDALVASLRLRPVTLADGTRLLVHEERWSALRTSLLGALTAHHRAEPAQIGLTPVLLTQVLPERPFARVLRAALDALVREGEVQRKAGQLCVTGHQAVLPPADEALLIKVTHVLMKAGHQAPALHDLLEPLAMTVEALRPFMDRMAQLGHLIKVSKHRYFPPASVHALALAAEALAAGLPGGTFTAAEYRDHSGIGRNATIEVLEYFDRVGLTQRIDRARRLRRAVLEVVGLPTP